MRRRSLARRIALTFLVADLLLLLAALVAALPIMLNSDDSIQFGPAIVAEAAAADLRTGPAGRIGFAATGRLAELRRGSPTLWLIARAAGTAVSLGAVPAEGRAAFRALPAGLETAEIRLGAVPTPLGDVAVERHESAAGPVLVMAGGVSPAGIGLRHWVAYLVATEMIWAVPLFVLLAVPAVLAATPIALRGLRPVTREAEAIGPDQPGRRLTLDRAPRELLPLVRAINLALDRQSAELERRRRFIADMSHEIRTPLAILGMRIAGLPAGAARQDLERGQARLTQMVGQMLDAERLAVRGLVREPVDLVAVARAMLAEAAPLAIQAGYSVALSGEDGPVIVRGDPHAIGRAVTNLLGNAVAHGGGGGLIELRIDAADRSVEVIDEGPGIPADARERVFEPFHRERWDRDGCGLGLHLVRQIMQAHGGRAEIPDGAGGRVRLTFPSPDPADG